MSVDISKNLFKRSAEKAAPKNTHKRKPKKTSRTNHKDKDKNRSGPRPPGGSAAHTKQQTKKKKPKKTNTTVVSKRPVIRKTTSPRSSKSKQSKTTTKPKLSKKEKKRKEKRKRKRKGKRKQKRRQKRQRMRSIEKSQLSQVPKGRVREFRLKFNKGKLQTRTVQKFKFLANLEFPFSDEGRLRSDFRKVVREKVINKLPDYCEQAVLAKSDKEKKECANRAKRIRDRVTQRLKELYF